MFRMGFESANLHPQRTFLASSGHAASYPPAERAGTRATRRAATWHAILVYRRPAVKRLRRAGCGCQAADWNRAHCRRRHPIYQTCTSCFDSAQGETGPNEPTIADACQRDSSPGAPAHWRAPEVCPQSHSAGSVAPGGPETKRKESLSNHDWVDLAQI